MAGKTVNGKTFMGHCYAAPHTATAAGRITPVDMDSADWITLNPESFKLDFSAEYGEVSPDGASFLATENKAHKCTWSATFALGVPDSAASEVLNLFFDMAGDQNTHAATTTSGAGTTTAIPLTSATNFRGYDFCKVTSTTLTNGAQARLCTKSGATLTPLIPLNAAPGIGVVVENGYQWVLDDDSGVSNQRAIHWHLVGDDGANKNVSFGAVGAVWTEAEFKIAPDSSLRLTISGFAYSHTYVAESVVEGNLTDSVTTINITSAGNLGPLSEFVIEAENIRTPDWQDILYAYEHDDIYQCTRGASSTTPAAHTGPLTIRPAYPSAPSAAQTVARTTNYKNSFLRVYHEDRDLGAGSIDVSEWSFKITRDLQPIAAAGKASDAVRYEMGPGGVKVMLSGSAPFTYGDTDTQVSHWVGHQQKQVPYVVQAEYGFISSAAGGGNRALVLAARSARIVKAAPPSLEEGGVKLDFEFVILKHATGVPMLAVGTI